MTVSPPARDCVDLWTLPLDRPPGGLELCERLLSPEERDRAARLRAPRDRSRLVARRGLLRRVLSLYVGVAPEAIRLQAGWAGKPELDPGHGAPGIAFNVARSGGLALCAVASERLVGVDLEASSAAAALQDAAADVLSPVEHAAWAALPAAQRRRMLLVAFCAKEALLKGRGEGLNRPLRDVALRYSNGAPSSLRGIAGEPPAATWRLRTLALGRGHVGVLATTGSEVRLRRCTLP